MKQILRILFMLLAATSGLNCYAGDKDEITLTVTSDGSTKDEAIKNALRTAIEQAYGAFVSANTTILNDELVKDEIVTVSNGSIKEYNILSEYENPNGAGYGVTAKATVSLPHLVTYAKNHGSECEFAGNTFGMELKLFNLQKENELKAIANLIPRVRELCKTTMSWSISIEEPRALIKDEYGYVLNNKNERIGFEHLDYFIKKVPAEYSSPFKNLIENPQSYCVIPIELRWSRIGNENKVTKYLYEALDNIGLDNISFSNMRDKGLDVCSYSKNNLWFCLNDDEEDGYHSFYFRNNSDSIVHVLNNINQAIREEKLNFHLVDNTGEYSDFHALELCANRRKGGLSWVYEDRGIYIYKIPNSDFYFAETDRDLSWPVLCINGTGLFKNIFYISDMYDDKYCFTDTRERDKALYRFDDHTLTQAEEVYQKIINSPSFRMFVILPLSEISKYSSLRVVSNDRID